MTNGISTSVVQYQPAKYVIDTVNGHILKRMQRRNMIRGSMKCWKPRTYSFSMFLDSYHYFWPMDSPTSNAWSIASNGASDRGFVRPTWPGLWLPSFSVYRGCSSVAPPVSKSTQGSEVNQQLLDPRTELDARKRSPGSQQFPGVGLPRLHTLMASQHRGGKKWQCPAVPLGLGSWVIRKALENVSEVADAMNCAESSKPR